MRRALLGLAFFAIALPGVAAQAQPSTSPTQVDLFDGVPILERALLLEKVLEQNPSIEAARQAWEAASAEIPQASSLEDPMASYSLAPLSIASSDSRFGDVLRIGQRIPYPGTLRLRTEAAEATSAAALQRIEQVRLRLATMASFLYDDYWLVDRALAITQEHVDLLDTFQRVAASRYASGTAPQQAPIQAEVESAHLLHRQVVLRTERRRLTARLNALLHRDPGAPLPPAPGRRYAEPEAIEVGAVGDPSRPEVAEMQAEIEALSAQVALEELRKKPDFEVMTSYNSMWGTSDHRWMVGVGLRLPIWRKRLRASVAEAEARVAARASELVALEDAIGAEVEAALASVDEAEHVVHLYRNRVLPASRDQLAAARAGFETGQGSMLDLIDAERSLLTAELSYEEALAEVSKARAQLDHALGRLPFGLVNEAPPPDSTATPNEDQP